MIIQLSDHFTYKRLLRFVASPILMMVFCSVYSVVDGLFVSNYAGKDAFAALNLIYPFINVLAAVGFMFGSGGTAIVSKTMGEGDNERANKYFTLVFLVAGGTGILLAVLGLIFLEPIAMFLGASGDNAHLLPLCKQYATITLCGLPFFMLQNMFQAFFSTAEKPKLGFVITLISGGSNIVLDALFVKVFNWGLSGAAIATTICQAVGGIVPIIYFARKNSSRLHFCKTGWYGSMLFKTVTNGFSELLGNICMSVVSMLYNKQLLRLVGADGVSAYGVICYVQFVFVAIYIGYTIGMTPLVGYNFGSQNIEELQNVFAKSLKLIVATAISMLILSIGLAGPIASVFVGYDQTLYELTVRGMRFYSLCYLFAGFNIFGSAFFTALNNGIISALISTARTLVFQVVCVLVLPIWFGVTGVWVSTVVAEFLSLVLTFVMLLAKNKKYGYIKRANHAV